jgi:hypothetical protein
MCLRLLGRVPNWLCFFNCPHSGSFDIAQAKLVFSLCPSYFMTCACPLFIAIRHLQFLSTIHNNSSISILPRKGRTSSEILRRITGICIGRRMSNYWIRPAIFPLHIRLQQHRLPSNDERPGMLYGNHIRPLIRGKTGLSRFQGVTYGLRAKWCYTDT